MLIANPIYDSVFKYLMEDDRVAKLFISTIIESKVVEVKLTPQERTAHIPSLGVTVFRLDFSAVILTAEGELKNVLIELQKADGPDDVRRFRRYLAENYYERPISGIKLGGSFSESENSSNLEKDFDKFEPDKLVLPIITIYLLGESLPSLQGYSAVKVKRSYFDAVTGEKIEKRESFIESLTHDSYVVQLSELNKRRRNHLEKMFSVFEQIRFHGKRHFKDFEEELPDEFQPLLDRLFRAALDRDILEKMIVEDEIVDNWKEKERQYEKAIEEERRQKEEERRQKEEKQMLLEEERRQKEEERRQKEEKQMLLEEERRQKEQNQALLKKEKEQREKLYSRTLEVLVKSGISKKDAKDILDKE
ncbi:MAG: hypothetical protein HQM08_24630 [Candidatus Riflebacteria bacterium]|nr:hypothetical protein [Candidatus Riflebacteria bacterium]